MQQDRNLKYILRVISVSLALSDYFLPQSNTEFGAEFHGEKGVL